MIASYNAVSELIRVRVDDGLTGVALSSARLAASIQSEGDGERPFPFDFRAAGAGWFVVAAPHRVLQARLRFGVATRLRLRASLPGYQMARAVVDITAAEFTVESATVDIDGRSITIRRVAGASFEQRMELIPRPVRLEGILIRDHDLSSPVAGATVTVNSDPDTAVPSNASGRFAFAELPLARTVEIHAALDGESTTATYMPDFRRAVNSMTLSLNTGANE